MCDRFVSSMAPKSNPAWVLAAVLLPALVTSLAACGGGAARYALLKDVDVDLDRSYRDNARLNAFYSSGKEPGVPDREAYRVSWALLCNGAAGEHCDGTARTPIRLKQE